MYLRSFLSAALIYLFAGTLVLAGERPTIAVLPFTVTGDKTAVKQYAGIGEALAEMLRTDLSFAPRLRPIGPTEVCAVLGEKGLQAAIINEQEQAAKTAKRLKVTHLIFGNVILSGQKVQVSIRVLKAADGSKLISANSSGNVTDLFTLTPELTKKIAEGLGEKIEVGKCGPSSQHTVGVYVSAVRASVLRQHRQALAVLRQIGPNTKRNRYIRSLTDILNATQWAEEIKTGRYDTRNLILLGDSAIPALVGILSTLDEEGACVVLRTLATIGADTVMAEKRMLLTLEKPNPLVRASAVRALRGTPSALVGATKGIHDPHDSVRIAAAYSTRSLKETEAIRILSKGLQDPSPKVRVAVGQTLIRLGTQDAMKVVKPLFSDQSPDVRLAVAQRCSQNVLAQDLEKLLDDPDIDIQLAAAGSLAEMGYAPGKKKLLVLARKDNRQGNEATLRILRGHFTRAVKKNVLTPLLNREKNLTWDVYHSLVCARVERINVPVGSVVKIFKRPNKKTSSQRVSEPCLWLANFGGRRGVAILVQNLSHPNKDIRLASIRALSTVHSKRIRNLLANLVKSGSKNPRNLTDILFAISKGGNPDYVDVLIKAVKSKDRDVRRAAADGLEDLAPAECVDLLAPLANDDYDCVRYSYAKMLSRIGSRKAYRILAKMASERNWVAIQAIGKSGDVKFAKELRPLLKDKNKGIKIPTARSLGALGDKISIPSLNWLIEHDPDMEVFAAAKAAIAQIKGGEDATANLLDDPRPYVRIGAVQQLACLKERKNPNLLLKSLHDRNQLVRVAAHQALVNSTTKDEIKKLLEELKSPNKHERQAIKLILSSDRVFLIPIMEDFIRSEKNIQTRRFAFDALWRLCRKHRRPLPTSLRSIVAPSEKPSCRP